MDDPTTHRTASGRVLTDADIEALADEAERGYDLNALRRRRGRPLLGSAPAEVVPVRIDSELKAAIDARATADETTTSEVIREALRRYLDVA
ncbi:MAG: ribbon-helix-helix domain-containing protein [Actinomycetota bacterium]|nr:ribbon-helix-helix domain-containing protein [Actinomycetota bacterium]